jgi:hypothetical protein
MEKESLEEGGNAFKEFDRAYAPMTEQRLEKETRKRGDNVLVLTRLTLLPIQEPVKFWSFKLRPDRLLELYHQPCPGSILLR